MAAEQTPLRRLLGDFAASRLALFGAALLGLVVVAAVFAPLISSQNPYDLAQLDVLEGRLPPGAKAPNGATF